MVEAADAAISARVAEECARFPSKEKSGEEEKLHADMTLDAKVQELDAWKQFKVFEPFKARDRSQYLGDGGWKEVRQGAPGGKRLLES